MSKVYSVVLYTVRSDARCEHRSKKSCGVAVRAVDWYPDTQIPRDDRGRV